MNTYLLIASFSGLFYAVSGVIYKASNKHLVRNPLRYLLFYNVFRVLVVALLLPWVSFSLPKGLELVFLLYSLCFFLGTLLTGLSLVNLDASVFMPLFNLQIIFTPLIAFFFLDERLSLTTYLLMGLVMIGGTLVTFSEESKRRRVFIQVLLSKLLRRDFKLPFLESRSSKTISKILAIFVIGLIFYSLGDNFAGRVLKQWDVASLIFWSGLLQLLFSLFLIPFIKGREEVKMVKLWPIPLGLIFSFFGLLTINFGFSYNVSLSQALSRLSSVYTLIIVVVLAHFKGDFLEKHPFYVYVVRFLGSGVMVIAAVSLLILK